MDSFFIVLLTFLGVVLAIYFVHYILTLPERRKNEEVLRREALLFKEKYEAEKVKQEARIAGEIARERIDKIANIK